MFSCVIFVIFHAKLLNMSSNIVDRSLEISISSNFQQLVFLCRRYGVLSFSPDKLCCIGALPPRRAGSVQMWRGSACSEHLVSRVLDEVPGQMVNKCLVIWSLQFKGLKERKHGASMSLVALKGIPLEVKSRIVGQSGITDQRMGSKRLVRKWSPFWGWTLAGKQWKQPSNIVEQVTLT